MNLDAPKVRCVTALLVGRLGDLIVSTAFLRGLRARFPEARIRLVVSAATRQAAGLIPFIDEILAVHPYWRPLDNINSSIALLAGSCDLLVDLNPSFSRTSTALALMARGRLRAAFAKGRMDSFWNMLADPPGEREHMLDRYARLAGMIGASYEPRMELRLRPDDERQAEVLMKAAAVPPGKLHIAVFPGNFKKFDNRWPEEKFAALCDRLIGETDLSLSFLAGPGEREAVAQIAASLKRPVPIFGPAPIGLTASLLKRFDLFLGNITGATHLAAAVGTATFGLYSGYTDAVWRLRGPQHSGVVAGSWESCRGIAVDEALRGLKSALAQRRGVRP
ncbi:MAG TPA: hypothetical protein DEB40_09560 [Elusimicrobia bacterium]|nr:hypothetical protein [Elusimicrobiota bacterium]HBT61975.1 hypothetical protein [Elusimicrobiota bacterium]